MSNTPQLNAWSGLAFEKVCIEHIPQIKNALGIAGVHTEVNSWQCNPDPDNGIFGSQIDLLIVRKDQIINLCEMKYSDTEFLADKEYDKAQKRKLSDFLKKTETKYAVHPTLVTTYGLIKTSYSVNIQNIITSEELFK